MRILNASEPCRRRIASLLAADRKPRPSKARLGVRPFQPIPEDAMAKRTLETGTTDLIAYVEDGVAVLVMNRPERRNALSGAMLSGMSHVLSACETDREV